MDDIQKQKTLKRIYALQSRVEALKDKFYTGCGFYYSLVDDAKKLITLFNDYDKGNIFLDIYFDVIIDLLTKSLVKAEKSAKYFDKKTNI